MCLIDSIMLLIEMQISWSVNSALEFKKKKSALLTLCIVCVCMCVCACSHACAHMHVCVCMCVCVYVCVCFPWTDWGYWPRFRWEWRSDVQYCSCWTYKANWVFYHWHQWRCHTVWWSLFRRAVYSVHRGYRWRGPPTHVSFHLCVLVCGYVFMSECVCCVCVCTCVCTCLCVCI